MDHQETDHLEMGIQVEIQVEKETVVQEDPTMEVDTEDQEVQEIVAPEDQMMEQDTEE